MVSLDFKKDLEKYFWWWLGLAAFVLGVWFFRGHLSWKKWFLPFSFFLGGLGGGLLFFLFPSLPWLKIGFRAIFGIFSFWLLISTPVGFAWGLVLGVLAFLNKKDGEMYKKDKYLWQKEVWPVSTSSLPPAFYRGLILLGEIVLLALALIGG